MNGGYKIINLHNTNFSIGEAQTIKGLYESIENSYNKVLMLAGINIAGVEYNNTFVNFTHENNEYKANVYANTITITQEDTITIS